MDKKSIKYEDLGNHKFDKNDDYPDFGYRVAKEVSKNQARGILICGSSGGVCIVANKVKGIRAVAVVDVKRAKFARAHNDANILCLSGWLTKERLAKKIVDAWLKEPFSKTLRHKRRVNKIKKYE